MTTMVTEVYDALREAGASEEKSRKAAEAIANYDSRLTAIDTRLTLLTWMIGVLYVPIIGILVKLLHA